MKTLVFDPSYGCAGDMILGAFVHAGVDFRALQSELRKLNLDGYTISAESVTRSHIAATKVTVETVASSSHRHLRHITEIVDKSSLGDAVKSNAKSIFTRLAEAEARVHATTPENVHFHEVGAVDAIVDVVGACICVDLLGIERVLSRSVAVGAGIVTCDHGAFPVPAPATAYLLKGFPVTLYQIDAELSTPTGAAIISTLAEPLLGPMDGTVRSIGYGAGTRSIENHPNLTRVFVIEENNSAHNDSVVEISTNIDDLNPQVYSYVFDKLYEQGALEVFITPIQMKKNRPGQLLTVLCEPQMQLEVERFLFAQTSTSGIRSQHVHRSKLPRRQETVETSLGECTVKVIDRDGHERSTPEYESVKKIADARGIPYLQAYETIIGELSDREKE